MTASWSKDPVAAAKKFLEQLRIVERENAALWEQIIDPAEPSHDPGATPLRAEYERLKADLATSERDRKKALREVGEMRRRLEAAGLDPDGAPMAATKSQRKDAINQAAAHLRRGQSAEALAILQARSA